MLSVPQPLVNHDCLHIYPPLRSLRPLAAKPSPWSTAGSRCRTTRSSRSSRATAPGRISGAPRSTCSTAPSRKAYGGKRKIEWFEVFAGEKAKDRLDSWLPDDTIKAIAHYLVAIKGPLTTPVGRRVPLAQRGAAAAARPLRLRAAGALVHRRALAGEAAGAGGHGDLPGEHGGYLRRHRVEGGHRRRRSGWCGSSGGPRRHHHPLPGDELDRHQADLGGGHASDWCARRSSTRWRSGGRA